MADDNVSSQEKVCIIGGGEIGSNLLNMFLKMEAVAVEYMVDIDPEAEGMQLAKENDIPTTTDLKTAVQDSSINIILEVTGSQEVLEQIRENKSRQAEIISGESSYFIYNLINEYKCLEGNLLTKVIEHLEDAYTAIEDDSKKVSDLLNQIEKITNNLNMLALNASIEAARAGEQGQGFSVVADEVKELSSESNEIVGEIEEVNDDIVDLNENIGQVISDLEDRN
ncbi:methyl-accepting chemotaxis protein [Halanaerobacter jeridensis]|uniref:Archaellum component FlaC n=1 Tax=Halanaerobacter jeridensis TaxID=706427 RepID=A0A938XS31_9FIRM|nr:methyl-accepting chemotaxis protein [Halanaerobacter jeridensis]MBM7555799.1 archaellum component FlaC [Halanaerobacter jeridensis]